MKPLRILITFMQKDQAVHPAMNGWVWDVNPETIIQSMVKENVELWELGRGDYSFDIFINGYQCSIDEESEEFHFPGDEIDEGIAPNKHREMGEYIRRSINSRTQHEIGKLVL